MRAIHVRIRQDADAPVAQTRQIGIVVLTMRINANSHRDIMNFVVGKQAVAFGFPCIEHFAAQRQNRLKFFVAPHLG